MTNATQREIGAEANRQLVIEFYRRMSRLDFPAMFDLMTDDSTWTVAGNPATFHHAGAYTKAQRMKGFSQFVSVFDSLEQSIVSTTAEADRVAVEVRTRCVTRQGLVYANELLILIRCRDGKIFNLYEHLDQQTSIEFERQLRGAA